MNEQRRSFLASALGAVVSLLVPGTRKHVSDKGFNWNLCKPVVVKSDYARCNVHSYPVTRKYKFAKPLEPVGMDIDGQSKPIDELQYSPTEKWVLRGEIHADTQEEMKNALSQLKSAFGDRVTVNGGPPTIENTTIQLKIS